MGKKNVSKEEIMEFRNTVNGAKKHIWMYVGMLIDFLASIGISILIINANRIPDVLYFYCGLFALLVLVVLGGELIGVYFGAAEQYFYDKCQKKVIKPDE